MKVLKIVIACILAIALIAAESTALGMFSMDRAVAESNVEKAIDDTDIVQSMTDEVLSENTVNMGGKYGDVINAAMETQAMNDFFSSYISSTIRSRIYGEPQNEIGSDEMLAAFSSAVDELREKGKTDISTTEEDVIKGAMLREVPDLTSDIDDMISSYDTTDSDVLGQSEDGSTLESLAGPGSRLIAFGAAVLLCAALIALMWRSKAGFIWCAVVSAVTALIFAMLGMLGSEGLLNITAGSLSEEFVLALMAEGFSDAAIAGGVIAALFIIAYIPLKIRDRKKEREEVIA